MLTAAIDEQRQTVYLKEMGLSTWELLHPERLEGYQAPRIDLPTQCSLLLVSPSLPKGQDASLFIKVLASMKLTPDQALHLSPEQLGSLGTHQLAWVWFAGCPDQELPDVKSLSSPLLNEIHGHQQHRRDLWQQICAYTGS